MRAHPYLYTTPQSCVLRQQPRKPGEMVCMVVRHPDQHQPSKHIADITVNQSAKLAKALLATIDHHTPVWAVWMRKLNVNARAVSVL